MQRPASRPLGRRSFLFALGGGAAVLLTACGAAATPTPQPAPPADKAAAPAPTAAPAAKPADTKPAEAKPADAPKPTEAPKPAEAAKPAAPAAAAPAAAVKGKNGILWGLQYDPHVERYNMLTEEFEKRSAAKLAVQPQSGDLIGKLLAALAAGTGPDNYVLIGKACVPLYLRNVLMDVNPVFKDAGLDPKKDYIGESVDTFSWEGKTYAVPFETNLVGSQVAVPVPEVEKAGIKDKTPPWNGKDFFDSWEHLWETANKLQVKDAAGKVSRWGVSSKGWETLTILGIMRTLGVNWWDNGAKKFAFRSDAGVQAFRLIGEQPVKLGVETEIDQQVVAATTSGKIMLAIGNASIPGEAKKVGYDYTQVMVPPIKGLGANDPLYVGEGGWGPTAMANAKNKDVATEFLKFATTLDAAKIWAGIYGGIPSPRSAANDDPKRWADTNSPVIQGMLRYTKHLDRHVGFGEGFGSFSEIIKHVAATTSEVRQGKLNPEQAAAKAQDLAESVYKQFQEDVKKV
ncbi:MAG TPA: extracellular solute-binding protein [Chloroflexota bacterium]|nr:extracellular solute-binding protein [Chloroflexota bacterium]